MNVMTVSHVNYDLTEFECDTASPLDGEFDPKSKSFQVCKSRGARVWGVEYDSRVPKCAKVVGGTADVGK